MTFSAEAWTRNLPLYEAIRSIPFNGELGDGTLSLARFHHYIVQDAHYLIAFGQALAVAAAKADRPVNIVQFAKAAQGAIEVERELHHAFFRRFGLEPEAVAATPMSPVCHHYVSFLLATAFREPLPVVVAAMLPCFWVYREVGRHILTLASAGNPFQDWIDTYGGTDFAVLVDEMIETTDGLASDAAPATLAAMHGAFTRATQLEWMFWNSAYALDGWPV